MKKFICCFLILFSYSCFAVIESTNKPVNSSNFNESLNIFKSAKDAMIKCNLSLFSNQDYCYIKTVKIFTTNDPEIGCVGSQYEDDDVCAMNVDILLTPSEYANQGGFKCIGANYKLKDQLVMVVNNSVPCPRFFNPTTKHIYESELFLSKEDAYRIMSEGRTQPEKEEIQKKQKRKTIIILMLIYLAFAFFVNYKAYSVDNKLDWISILVSVFILIFLIYLNYLKSYF